MEQMKFRWMHGTESLRDAFAVRREVFCEEQGYSPADEFDETDGKALHVVLYDGDCPAAAGRLYGEGCEIHLGRIAVRRPWRGRGVGAALVREMLRAAGETAADTAVLDAQCRVIGFYESLGFTVSGEEHMDGHVPHRMMRRPLRPATEKRLL